MVVKPLFKKVQTILEDGCNTLLSEKINKLVTVDYLDLKKVIKYKSGYFDKKNV